MNIFLRRYWHRWLLAGVFFTALFLRYGGFDRPIGTHPDQTRIVSWMERANEEGKLRGTVYPGGFFTLFNTFQAIIRPFTELEQAWLYKLGKIDRKQPAYVGYFALGRHFNIWLAGCTCLIVYLLAKTISGRRLIGIFSALLLCFSPIHIIHSYYLETDIAMVFTLTLSLWLWALFVRCRSWWVFAVAAAASGFAAGTKYTLICLLPLGLIFSFYTIGQTESESNRLRRVFILLVLTVGLFVFGFLIACPAAMDWNDFYAGMRWEGMRVFGEGKANLGLAHGEPMIRLRVHWREFYTTATTMLGWPGIMAGILGLIAAFARPYRLYLPIMVMFPLCYLYYYFFQAPWVRSQEFMNLMPIWAVLAGLFPAWLWQRRKKWTRTLAIAVGMAVLTVIAGKGLLAESPYQWKDTRVLVNRWIKQRLPDSATLGLERYTKPAEAGAVKFASFIHKIETCNAVELTLKYDFILRNPTSHGRSLRHPVTGRRYEKYQKAYEDFTNQAEKLCAWGTLPPDYFKSPFSSPDIELWYAKRCQPELHLQIPLSQPGMISDISRETYFESTRGLGGLDILLINKYARQFAYGGPEQFSQPVFALANTLERPAELFLHGFGQKFKGKLKPYQAAVFKFKRPVWRPRLNVFEVLTAGVKPVPHITYVPCLLRPAFDIYEAAGILQQSGHSRQALALLKTVLEPDSTEMYAALIYPLAVAESEWELAEKWREAADKLLGRLREAMDLPAESIAVNRRSGSAYNQCARIRLLPMDQTYKLSITPDKAVAPEELPSLPPGITMRLPARLARGYYTLAAEIRSIPIMNADPAGGYAVYDFYGKKIVQGDCKSLPEDFLPVELDLAAGRETQAWLHFVSTVPLNLELRNMELRWGIHRQIRALLNGIVAARATHALHDENPKEALDLLLRQAAQPDWNELEIQRLEFQALLASDADPEKIKISARRLLDAVPDYWPARHKLAPETAKNLAANLSHPILFPPFLNLVGVNMADGVSAMKSTAGKNNLNITEFELIFEALDDAVPPLDMAIFIYKKGRWRRRDCLSVNLSGRLMQRGARVRVKYVLDNEDAAGMPPDKIGIKIQSGVRWSPGILQPDGQADYVISLDKLL